VGLAACSACSASSAPGSLGASLGDADASCRGRPAAAARLPSSVAFTVRRAPGGTTRRKKCVIAVDRVVVVLIVAFVVGVGGRSPLHVLQPSAARRPVCQASPSAGTSCHGPTLHPEQAPGHAGCGRLLAVFPGHVCRVWAPGAGITPGFEEPSPLAAPTAWRCDQAVLYVTPGAVNAARPAFGTPKAARGPRNTRHRCLNNPSLRNNSWPSATDRADSRGAWPRRA